MSRLRLLVLLPLVMMAAACTSSFKADVSSFHRLQRPEGETIKIVAIQEEKKGSLELASYAEQIAPYLQRLGYRVVGREDESQLEARIDYGVSDGNTMIRSYPSYGYWGYYHYGYYPGYWYYPWGPFYGRDVDIRSTIVYSRWLHMQIVRADLTPDNPDWMVYEGHVQSTGSNERLHEVMPFLIEALFSDFPGESGLSRTVKIPLE